MLKSFATAMLALLLVAPAIAATDVEVSINGGAAPLKGSMTWPAGSSPVPAVLILPGSGPTDRNGNGPGGLNTDSYRLMASAFADQGVATLRIDKRGVAASVAAAQREEDLRFETYVEDTVSWMNFLRAQKRVSRIIVLGHSEGALIGSIAVQRAGAAGFISLSGAGYRASDVLRQQLGSQLTGELKQQAFSAIAELESGRLVKNPPPALAALFRPSVQPYLISWFRYDPAVEIAKVAMPVLIVQGTTDLQVSVDDARRLAGGKPDAVLKLLDGMNHVLRAAPAERAANLATYSNPALPLQPELMPALIAFVGN